MGGGVNTYAVTGYVGRLDLTGNYSSYLTDQSSAKTNGTYWRAVGNATREQTLADDWTLAMIGQAQLTSGNLDGSEQFSFGGMDSMRGYPSGQAAGDSGASIQTELRWAATPELQMFQFYDVGIVKQHMKPWDGWEPVTGQPDIYALQSVGAGCNWSPGQWLTLKAVAAIPVGPNLAHNANYQNLDGTSSGPRGWLQATLAF